MDNWVSSGFRLCQVYLSGEGKKGQRIGCVHKGVILVIVESESGQVESECGVCFGSGVVMRREKLTRATTGTLVVASLEYCVVQRSLR